MGNHATASECPDISLSRKQPHPTNGQGKRRRFPIGAEVWDDGVHFRIWAPKAATVSLQFDSGERTELLAEPDGYFSKLVTDINLGARYKFQIESGLFPDPASRFQPDGPHGASQVVDGRAFNWTDITWRGVPRDRHVIYEMHIGTFTSAGNWRSASERLPQLVELGVTTIEVMPVTEFPGRFGWGYDGVNMFAPTRLYGSPDDFRDFVNRAHGCGLAVILDVVYNHFGPDGNYITQFAADYLTNRHHNEWGDAINFDGLNNGPVREFFITNAGYWIEEFHLDGLRLDATQQILDSSNEHILSAIARRVREAGRDRETFLVAENEKQHSRIVRANEKGGYGLDALWNDDFHHSAVVAVTGHNAAYYSDHRGTPQEFISAMKRGYLFQGQWYSWQKQRRGSPTTGVRPTAFINCIENHDQIANSLHGSRLRLMTSPGRWRALTALLLLGPATPMLFQGQEFGSSAPFLYFADHDPELANLVASGRRKFVEQFPNVADPACRNCHPDPCAEETFCRSKLNWAECERHAEVYALHRDLLKLRREDAVFREPRNGGVDGAVLTTEAFLLRFFGDDGDDRLLLVNFGADLPLVPMPEPLLAPPEGRDWKLIWSSEHPHYGGGGTAELTEGNWRIPGHAALVLSAGAT